MEQKAPAKAFHVGNEAEAWILLLPWKGSRGGGRLVLLRGINEQRREAGRGERGVGLSVYLEAFVPAQGLSFGLCLIRCALDSAAVMTQSLLHLKGFVLFPSLCCAHC